MINWSELGYVRGTGLGLALWVAFSLALGAFYILLHEVCHWAADRWRERKRRKELTNV